MSIGRQRTGEKRVKKREREKERRIKILNLAYFGKIQVNPIHTILKCGNYYDFMDR